MTAFSASAPGKIILFGEHAVVYGRPAIAVPVSQVQAKATVLARPTAPAGEVLIRAPQIGLDTPLDRLSPENPLRLAIDGVCQALNVTHLPALELRINSTISIASGLGSGAAVSVAVIRALLAFLGHPPEDEQVNALAYEVEKAHHGTPSGIDNTVIAYAQPILFRRDQPFETLRLSRPLTFVIGDSGQHSPTHLAVGDVRKRWQADPATYEALFDQIAAVVGRARLALTRGDLPSIGAEMTANQKLLEQLDVSSPRLDELIHAANQAGAYGAKLCGAGRGGNMIALADEDKMEPVAQALRESGAVQVIVTKVG